MPVPIPILKGSHNSGHHCVILLFTFVLLFSPQINLRS
jgi:hypothetical protein